MLKTDAALIIKFYNTKKEDIGTKVITLRNIEPQATIPWKVVFKPQEGDIVSTCSLNIGDLSEDNFSIM
jgi:hypothetical protein